MGSIIEEEYMIMFLELFRYVSYLKDVHQWIAIRIQGSD